MGAAPVLFSTARGMRHTAAAEYLGDGRQAWWRPRAGAGMGLVMWRFDPQKSREIAIKLVEDNIGENRDGLSYTGNFRIQQQRYSP